MAYIDRAVVYAINCLVRVRDNIDTVPVVKSLRAMKFEGRAKCNGAIEMSQIIQTRTFLSAPLPFTLSKTEKSSIAPFLKANQRHNQPGGIFLA